MAELQRLSAYALGKPGAWPDDPWGDHPVAKVHDKIFCFLGTTGIGVKCGDNRAEADDWLQTYPQDAAVMAYIGRSGWNTLSYGGTIPETELRAAIDESYLRVVEKLPRKHRPAGWDAHLC